jgi:subtilisin-like proprotein convertase family protein
VTISVGGGGAVNYPDIPAEGAASMSVPFTVPADAPCGSLLPVSVVITSSVGTVTRTYNLQIGRPVITATSNYSAVNVPVQTQDGATVEIPINITDLGVVADVNARVRLNHTFDGDMTIELVGPDGTSVVLANGRGASGDNYGTGPNNCSGVPTVFDDSAPTGANVGFAPFEGVFKPEDPLSAFNGKAVAGTWKLRVTDFFLFDQGSIGCFQLEIVRQRLGCCGVPGANIQAAPPVAVVSESCLPGNGAPDPDETVTVNFPLMNLGVANTTNLVATLMPGGGVLAPSGPQSYGALVPDAPAVARPFTFIVAGMCGGDLTATLALQDGATSLGTVTFPIRIGAAVAGAATFANTAPLIIPATGGTGAGTGAPADLYPSTIEVSGVTGTVTKVTAQIFGFNHTFPGDVDILLVGPGGQKILLLSDAGGGTDAVNANMTFDDTAPEVGAAVVTGVFRPTNIGAGDLFPAPAPAGPYPDPQQLSAFNGVNPNGAWSLYVVDDAGADVGRINGGWSLTINTSDPVCCSSACALSAPANITVTADPGASGAVVNYPAPTFTGSCGVVTSDPPSGFFFPIGTTTVMVTGTRQDGTVTATSFTVTVNAADDPDDDQCGKVTGGGTIVLNGKNASFGFNARFKRPDDVQGEFEFTLHGHGRNGKKEIKSASIDTLTVDGDTGIFTGKARLNGAGNYKFTVTVVDKGEPGRHGHGNDHGPGRGGKDKFGLRVTAPNGTVVSDLTFDPTSLKGGNIQVHSAACPGHRRHGHRRGDRHDDRCDDRPGDHNGRK